MARWRIGGVAALAGALLVGCSTPSGEPTIDRSPVPTFTVRSEVGIRSVGDHALPSVGNPDIDVTHYELDLRYDPPSQILDARIRLDITPVVPLTTMALDYRGPELTTVTVDGRAVPRPARTEGRLEIEVGERDQPLATPFTLAVEYRGTPGTAMSPALPGVELGWHSTPAGSFVISEPDGASTFLPVNNHPLDKATYDVTVTVPAPFVAVANGVGQPVQEENGQRTYRWEMAQPMASYLLTVVTGRLVDGPVSESEGVALQNWSGEGSPPALTAPLDAQGEDLRQLSGLLGPFPFPVYGGVLLPRSLFTGDGSSSEQFLQGVALETQSRSVFGTASAAPDTVVHELAHQWMGDSVSLTDWSRDIWWVEGFAHYSQWLLAERLGGREAYDREVKQAEATGVHGPLGARPVGELFTEPTYVGGALVFAALRAKVGDSSFGQILRTFQDRHRHANATTEDLVRVASEVSGQDLAPFFSSWLEAVRLPAVG